MTQFYSKFMDWLRFVIEIYDKYGTIPMYDPKNFPAAMAAER